MSYQTTERFDIYDEAGHPIGTETREEVHTVGHWHRTFHCWLVRRDREGRARILFQRRSERKDTNPGCYDITAAGHLTVGETPADAVRELEEELGLSVRFEELVPYGVVREEGSGEAGGRTYIDREISDVFGYVTDWPPGRFRLQEEEVAGLYEADADRLIAMMEGDEESVEAEGVELAAESGGVAWGAAGGDELAAGSGGEACGVAGGVELAVGSDGVASVAAGGDELAAGSGGVACGVAGGDELAAGSDGVAWGAAGGAGLAGSVVEASGAAGGAGLEECRVRVSAVTVLASEFVPRDRAYYIGVMRFLRSLVAEEGDVSL
ncbi:NUDIX domain-containing protein [Cohnella sp. CFH 77786]|uniref:NUDIX hydrolase n=1 Tax=Cohnella sp. CFH 77786 TaxID=2662265 RepID=UPI001C608BBE|nr:NUDIX domain-containing protein [Cohnella sp. CFH 77786]MBW5445452.1 NUDIX domain-containing protein [Cohnella sp. CFH 77786]